MKREETEKLEEKNPFISLFRHFSLKIKTEKSKLWILRLLVDHFSEETLQIFWIFGQTTKHLNIQIDQFVPGVIIWIRLTPLSQDLTLEVSNVVFLKSIWVKVILSIDFEDYSLFGQIKIHHEHLL